MKTAIFKKLKELNECTGCHCYTISGYELRDGCSTRFVCEECYQSLAAEYPICRNIMEIPSDIINQIVSDSSSPRFQAGYLFGKRESNDNACKLTITNHLNSSSPGRTTVLFFCPDDIAKIRKITRECGDPIIAIYRTNPSGLPEFNELDSKTVSDMTSTMPYVIFGGKGEFQIAARDKNYPTYEYGVTII